MSFARLILCGLLGVNAMGQDVMKFLPTLSDTSETERSTSDASEPWTFRAGDSTVLVSMMMQGEWNDNIALTDHDTLQDFILRPELNLSAAWPITSMNQLEGSVGVGYEEYIEHPKYSRFLITPGSELKLTATMDALRLTLRDIIAYENDPSLYGNISGIARIGGLFNTVGIDVTRDFKFATSSISLDHGNFWSSSSTYAYLDKSDDYAAGRVIFRPAVKLKTGIDAGAGYSAYKHDTLSSYYSCGGGVFARYELSESAQFTTRGGYLHYGYSRPELTQNTRSVDGYYAQVEGQVALADHTIVTCGGGREESVSIDGGLIQQWHAEVGAEVKIVRNANISTSVRYENARQPFENPRQGLIFSRSYERALFQAAFSYPVTRKIDASLTYNFLLKSADNAVANYTVNSFTLAVTFYL